MVARLERRFSQFAQPAHGVRRHRHGLRQHGLGRVERTDRLVRARQPVVGVDEILVGVDELFQHVARFVVALAQEQRLGQAQARPGDGLRLDQLAVDRLRFRRLAEEHVQLGAQAQEVDDVARMAGLAGDAGVDRLALVARFHQFVHGQQRIAPFQAARDAFEQAVGRERFQDVVGGAQLGGADDLAVVAFGRNHEEHRRQRHQFVVAHVLEQLLAVLSALQRVLAQDQVVVFEVEMLDGLVRPADVVDLAQAAQVQHVVDRRAHARMRFDDQCAQAFKFVHIPGSVVPALGGAGCVGPLIYELYYVQGTKILNLRKDKREKLSRKTTLPVTRGPFYASGWRAAAWRSGVRRRLGQSVRLPPIMMFW